MKAIVAGYSKTGTKTMAEALRILGFNVHDTMEHFVHHRQLWYNVIKGRAGLDEIRESYRSVDVVVGFPTFYFWQQLSKAFPEAQIILTERDEESWVESVIHQHHSMAISPAIIFLCCFSWTGWKLFYFHKVFFGLVIGLQPFLPLTEWPDSRVVRRIRYRAHNTSIIYLTPEEKLLRYSVKQGWNPLCEFLRLDKPATDFPHKNVHATVYDERVRFDPTFQRMKKEACFVTLLILSFIVLLAARFLL